MNMCYVPRFVFRNLHHSWKCYYLFVFLQEPKTQCENARDTFQEGASWCSRFPLFTRLSHRAPGMFALGFFHVVKSFFYFPRLVLKGFDFTTGNLSIIIFPFPGGLSKWRGWFALHGWFFFFPGLGQLEVTQRPNPPPFSPPLRPELALFGLESFEGAGSLN